MFVHTFYTSADLPGFFQDTFEPGKALKSHTYVIIVDPLMNLFITKVAYNELLMTLKYILSLPDFFCSFTILCIKASCFIVLSGILLQVEL